MADLSNSHQDEKRELAAVGGSAAEGAGEGESNAEAGAGRTAGRRRRRGKWSDVADTRPMATMDADVYSTKKTVAQGFMDLALLSANADQLRTLVRTGDADSPFYIVCVVFLSISLILQVVIAICLMLKGRYNINKPTQFRAAERLNNCSMVVSVFLTVLNVLVSSFMPEVPASTQYAAAGGMGSAAVGSVTSLLPDSR